ncbi:MAG: Flp pilus assembly protein TadD [Glaciecola sp.]|uniref:tetratricopeptide repeat-containing sulfotransferase family protein n=1 Tax=Congregibacter sp. TaxID=2744308 RepID=UPI0039E270F4
MSVENKPPSSHARYIFENAAKLLQAEDFVAAEQLLLEALEALPNDPNLLRLLGVSLAKQRRFHDAEQRLMHVVRLIPEHSRAYEDVADVQLAQRKLEDALTSLRSAIRHAPDPARVQQRLAELLSIMGRSSEAETAFEGVLDADPVRKDLAGAMEQVNQGNLKEAETLYTQLLRGDPHNVDALRLFGILQVKRERYDDAAAYFRRAVELAPDFWKAWINLGTAYSELQRFDEAESAYQSALALQPRSVHVLERLGSNAMKAGELTKSVQWLEQSLTISSQHFPSLLCLGHALKTLGRQDEAVDAYRRCMSAKADFGEAYWSLANLKTFRFDDDDIATMQEQLEIVADSVEEEKADAEIAFSFALGKACEDRKDYANAFEYYSRGNTKKRFTVNYDPIEFQDNNDRIIEVFSREFFAERQGWGCQDEAPILVVGLPRSGSTLLEQILASHSQVEGTAELHYLLRAATQSGLNRTDGIRYPQVMHELQAHHVLGLGEEYIESTLKHRTGSPRFTDKMPNNFTAIGFLHTILPKARVIDARRHPLDSCLGTFKQLFANGQVFSYDLYDLAHYYGQYVRLMDHWAEVLPDKVHTVHYENVVDDLETEARAIAEYCGLSWEESMLEFHRNTRAVKTASSEQVRQPIYRSSVSLWRRYEGQLGELIEYLEPVLARLPEKDQPVALI